MTGLREPRFPRGCSFSSSRGSSWSPGVHFLAPDET